MKTLALAILWTTLALSASAQTLFTFTIGRAAGTEVRVANDTNNGLQLELMAGDQKVPGFLGKSGQWKAFYGPGTGDVPVFIQVCKKVIRNKTSVLALPPSWAMDQTLLGDAALTTSYLQADPKQSDLRNKVKAIEGSLHDRLGHKEKANELKAWFRGVEKIGLTSSSGGTCEDPKLLAIRVRVLESIEHRVIILVIRGDYEKLRIDGPRDAWY